MGALSVPRGFGGMIYGAARGAQDAERSMQLDEAHATDQAIRTQRLENETELQPLRTRALELGVQEAERTAARRPTVEAQEDEIRALGIDTARMTKKERETALERLAKANKARDSMTEGLRNFYRSSDPQHVVAAFESISDIKEEHRGAQATRNEDGSITLSIPGMQPQHFKAGKDKAGNPRTADDYFGMFATKMLDPVGRLTKELEEEYGLAKEQERTERAIGVANIRGRTAVQAAGVRGDRDEGRRSDAWYNRQHTSITRTLDSMLKPEQSPSGFAAAYAFDSDKALRGLIEERVENEIDTNGTPVRQASRRVIDDVRAGYDALDKKAKTHASALAKSKVKPTDRAAVEAAAKQGNRDALELLKVYKVAEKNLGSSVAKYLESQLPNK